MADTESGLVYRTDDTERWGGGKGANLTPEEVDGNFWTLHSRIQFVEDNPPAAVYPTDVTMTGYTVTFEFSNGDTFGPFEFVIPQQTIVGINEVSGDTSGTYVLITNDAGKYIRYATGDSTESDLEYNTLEVPDNEDVPFPIGTVLTVHQVGDYPLVIQAENAATINTSSSYQLRTNHSTAALIKVGEDEWDLSGDLVIPDVTEEPPTEVPTE